MATTTLLASVGALSLRGGAGAAPAAPGLARLVLAGRGDGPGIGMGQWGAFGYAVRYHFGYGRILAHYYGGTHLTTLAALGRAGNPVLKVVILENLDLQTNVGYDPVVTASSTFSVLSQPATAAPTTAAPTTATPASATSTSTSPTTTALAGPPSGSGPSGSGPSGSGPSGAAGAAPAPTHFVVPAGMAVDLHLEGNGTWSAFEGRSCAAASAAAVAGQRPVATGLVDPVAQPPSSSPSAPPTRLLTLCRHDHVDVTLRGAIQAFDRQGYERTLNLVPLESYLRGVVPGEVSPSWGSDGTTAGAPQGQPWGFQALEAQAVAARSYALAMAGSGGWMGYADICDSTYCQAYVGVSYETPATDAAVAATAGQVLVEDAAPSDIVLARYAASSGGWTAPSAFPAVADLGDACVVPGNPLECNPVHTWQLAIPAATLAQAFPGIGTVRAVRVVQRDHVGPLGGRVLTVQVAGTRKSEVVPASTFVANLDLYSDWFSVVPSATVTGTSGAPQGTSGTSGPEGTSGTSGAGGASGTSGAPTTTTTTTTTTTPAATTTTGAGTSPTSGGAARRGNPDSG